MYACTFNEHYVFFRSGALTFSVKSVIDIISAYVTTTLGKNKNVSTLVNFIKIKASKIMEFIKTKNQRKIYNEEVNDTIQNGEN